MAPAVNVKVPVLALNVPPVPVNLVQVPPACSPVIIKSNGISEKSLAHKAKLPSVPAFACGVMVTVTTLVSLPHGAAPVITYLNVDVVAPAAGT